MRIPGRPAARFILVALAGLILVGGESATPSSSNVYKNIQVYNRVLASVYDKYVEKVESKDLIYASIEGMMGVLDQHSAFLEKKQYDDLMLETQGKYGGVGIEIDIRDGWLTVVSPIEGTPAFNLGIRGGDRIVAIEGESTKGITTAGAASKLRGPRGTKVVITIERPGEPSSFDIELVREVIEIKAIPYKAVVRDGVGYVKLLRFSEDSGAEVESALRDLQEAGAKSIVFDLRGNHGGLLTQAVSVSEKFLDKGKMISYTQGRDPSDRKEFHATGNPVLKKDIPLVILVNRSTASASEIVAGALQDDHRAVIMGEPTYGKGLVQTLIPIDSDTNLKLTTAKWYTPSGRCIQREDEPEEEEELVDADESSIEIEKKGEIETKKDEGGIIPNIAIEAEKFTRYAFELERQNLVFKFAIDYTSRHPNIGKDFVATDAILNEFKEYLKKQDFKYESASEQEFQRLKDLAKEEGYEQGIEAASTALVSSLESEKAKDFDRNRDYISFAIEREILRKEKGREGLYVAMLRKDPAFDAAVDLLLKPDDYRKIVQTNGPSMTTSQ
jgi:carboxyl-terminal processing protease